MTSRTLKRMVEDAQNLRTNKPPPTVFYVDEDELELLRTATVISRPKRRYHQKQFFYGMEIKVVPS